MNNATDIFECSECKGEGRVEWCTGWKQTGPSMGDCYETFASEDCEACNGSGEQRCEECRETQAETDFCGVGVCNDCALLLWEISEWV